MSGGEYIGGSDGGDDSVAIRVWDAMKGEALCVMRGVTHKSDIHCLVQLGDGPLVASGSRDGAIGVWNVSNGSLLHFLCGTMDEVLCLAPLGDNLLVSGDQGGNLCIWNALHGCIFDEYNNSSRKRGRRRRHHAGSINCLASCPDGRLVVGSGSPEDRLALETGTRLGIWAPTGRYYAQHLPDGIYSTTRHL